MDVEEIWTFVQENCDRRSVAETEYDTMSQSLVGTNKPRQWQSRPANPPSKSNLILAK
jgi:hypothetical protein